MIRITMNKSAFILLILSCVFMLATCQFKGCGKDSKSISETPDTLFLNQWRKEKKEKADIILSYESRIALMRSSSDSLRKEVDRKKQSIAGLRFKVNYFEQQLRSTMSASDTSSQTVSFLDSLSVSQNQSDSMCDETINSLERLVCNRDSVIAFHQVIENNLKDLQQRDKVDFEYLTERLNDALKMNRRKTIQNKVLAGGLLLLSGISTSLLVTQQLK